MTERLHSSACAKEGKRLLDLQQKALRGSSRAVINATLRANGYSGILAALVAAGSTSTLAKQLGVNYQAVQQWVKAGHVPLGRITEIEALYGIPRADLIDPKYAAAIAEPNFSSDV